MEIIGENRKKMLVSSVYKSVCAQLIYKTHVESNMTHTFIHSDSHIKYNVFEVPEAI